MVLLLCTLSLVVGEEGEGGEGGEEGSGGELEEGEDQLSKNNEVKESRGTYFYCKSNQMFTSVLLYVSWSPILHDR